MCLNLFSTAAGVRIVFLKEIKKKGLDLYNAPTSPSICKGVLNSVADKTALADMGILKPKIKKKKKICSCSQKMLSRITNT